MWRRNVRVTFSCPCVFEQIQAGVIGEVKQPVLDDWSKLADLRPPVEMLNVDIDAINASCAASDSFMLGNCCPRPFERMQFLRGSENLYLDLAEESSEVLELLRIVADFYRKELELWSRTRVDGLIFMDDWGSQRSLLINPAQWRRLFKPLYAEYAAIAHAAGKKLFMHSDGHIQAIYPDLVEIGVDAVNSQLFCMDIEEIGRRCKGRITFWGEMDRQNLLPYGTEAEVRAAVGRVVENLWSPVGGVIAQFELSAGSNLRNAQTVFQTWQELTGTTMSQK
jgi:uroporphyrinogen decarboxylase